MVCAEDFSHLLDLYKFLDSSHCFCTSALELTFSSAEKADIVHRALEVDLELKPELLQRTVTRNGATMQAYV